MPNWQKDADRLFMLNDPSFDEANCLPPYTKEWEGVWLVTVASFGTKNSRLGQRRRTKT